MSWYDGDEDDEDEEGFDCPRCGTLIIRTPDTALTNALCASCGASLCPTCATVIIVALCPCGKA